MEKTETSSSDRDGPLKAPAILQVSAETKLLYPYPGGSETVAAPVADCLRETPAAPVYKAPAAPADNGLLTAGLTSHRL